MKPKCLITSNVAGPCTECGERMEPAHIGEEPLLGMPTLKCSKCCGCVENQKPQSANP